MKKLRECAKFFSGGTPKTTNKDFYNGQIPFIRSGEINAEKTELFISENGLSNSSAKMVNRGDLLIALYGATSGEIAISKINGAINQAVLCVRTDENKEFLKGLWLKHIDKILRAYLQGGQGNLSAEIVKSINFSFPTLPEQNKIAEFLSKLDERIQTQRETICDVDKLRQSLNDDLFKKYGNDIEISLSDLGKSYAGLLGKTAIDFGKGKPYVTYKNVFKNDIISEDEFEYVNITTDEKQNKVKYGDALFTISSETPAEVGMCSVYFGKEQELYLNSFCFGYRLNDNNTLIPEYLPYLFSNSSFRKFIYPFAQGSTRYNLLKSSLMVAKFTIPTVENQKRITNLLSKLSQKLKTEQELLSAYEQQKKYFLQNMFV